ncbi:NUDIX hydrolase [Rhizobium rhizogenes]|uniref:NUDIX hydrolase n=1 Tax=Rhizobium rhizogenes TaxID=359 RepID=UPI001572B54B|nr:NUDIX hydrolase [Rhizobium rhizogenes]NTF66023.1 NUDIX hydrolase [Rhizobium rhizogenes]NTG97408.1 NUDIX hydrolase [Rhizobium rhizogenes]
MKPKKEGRKPSPDKSKHLLKQLAQTPDKLFAGVFRSQFGALCFRYKDSGEDFEILVITSRDSGRWIIPKGWPMKGKKPYEAAAIEAWEEAGVRGTVRKKPIGRYTYLKDLDHGNVAPCIVEMFQIEVKEVRADFKEKGQRVLHWVTPDEAARQVREIELKSLIVHFSPQTKKSQQSSKDWPFE